MSHFREKVPQLGFLRLEIFLRAVGGGNLNRNPFDHADAGEGQVGLRHAADDRGWGRPTSRRGHVD